ncbi:MAG: glycosyltransferase [Armatimonadota bacterium]
MRPQVVTRRDGALRILHVTSYYEPAWGFGGIVRAVSGACEALCACGHEVSVLTTNASPNGRLDVPLERAHRRDGVTVTYFPLAWRGWPLGRFYYSAALARASLQHVRQADVTHLSMVWGHPAAAASRVCRREGTPYVVSPHGTFLPPHYARKRWKKSLWMEFRGRGILHHAAAIHAISRAEVRALARLGLGERTAYVPNGVNVREFAALPGRAQAVARWPRLRDRRAVLFLSRLHPGTGLHELIPAFARVRRAHDDVVLIRAGPNAGYERQAHALVGKHDLDEHVLFTGMLTGADRLLAFAAAHVFVLPSHAECLPMAALEALACGLPAVTTAACNLPEVQRVGAGLVVAPDADAIATALDHILSLSESRLEAMGARGRALAESQFAWDTIARKMTTLYRCILHAKPVPPEPEPFDGGAPK